MLLRHYVFILIVCVFTGAMVLTSTAPAPVERRTTEMHARLPVERATKTADEAFAEMLEKQDIVAALKQEQKDKQDALASAKKEYAVIQRQEKQSSGINIMNVSPWYNIPGIIKNYKDKSAELNKYQAMSRDLSKKISSLRDEIEDLSSRIERAKRDAKEAKERITEIKEMDTDITRKEWFDIANLEKTMTSRFSKYETASQTSAFIAPVRGEITSPFGYRIHPIDGYRKFHSGVDIGVDTGTPVRASNYGVVVLSEWYGGFGNCVILSHGNGAWTLYGHNSELAVKEGDVVRQGQIVAYAGSTGHSTGPHVHFSMWQDDELVDPLNYIIGGVQ